MSLSPLATHMMGRFSSLGEALLCNAVFNSPGLFRKEKPLLQVNNMVHNTAIQFSSQNRLYKQVFDHMHRLEKTEANWNRIMRLIPIYPEVVKQVFPYQADNTLLMHVMYNKPSAKVVRALLEVAPEHVGIISFGFTPLHTCVFMSYRTSIDVLQELLSVPEAKQAALTQDDRGFTPLHYSIHECASLEHVKALLAVAPEAAKIKSNRGWTPLQLTRICSTDPSVKEVLIEAMKL